MGQQSPLIGYREKRGISRAELAAEIGVSRMTVWRWETGRRRIEDEILPTVSDVTGISKAKLRPDLAALLSNSRAA